ncbi:MAG: excinuclease ABC subunit UvrC [Ruthenibacterium sp.]
MTKQQLWEKAKMLPLLPGVYIIRDKEGQIIYIGKAKRLRTRVSQYFREGVPHDAKVTKMISHAFEFDVIVTQSEFEALVLECSQIKQHKPKYNILLKDDKGYSYVKVTREKWPRLSAALQKDDENADYYGPFTSSFAVREMVEAASDVFRLPRCTRRFPQDIGKGRPCLNAHIGKCMAVCSGKIRNEDYREAVESALHMIRHGQADIMKTLKARMEDAAGRLDFERAALIRDQLAAIEKVSRGQKVVRSEVAEQDVIAFAGSANAVCAAILRFREGRLADKREFLFHDTQDIAALRDEFLPRYYLEDNEFIPKASPWTRHPRARSICSAFCRRQRAQRCSCMCPSAATRKSWWRWRAPTPSSALRAKAGAMRANSARWTKRPICWACAPPRDRKL